MLLPNAQVIDFPFPLKGQSCVLGSWARWAHRSHRCAETSCWWHESCCSSERAWVRPGLLSLTNDGNNFAPCGTRLMLTAVQSCPGGRGDFWGTNFFHENWQSQSSAPLAKRLLSIYILIQWCRSGQFPVLRAWLSSPPQSFTCGTLLFLQLICMCNQQNHISWQSQNRKLPLLFLHLCLHHCLSLDKGFKLSCRP